MTAESLYPLLVPASWFQEMAGFRGEFGHGIEMTLVEARPDCVRSITLQNVTDLGGEDLAFRTAIENLEGLAHRREVGMRMYPQGPGDQPFLLFGGHWAAATCLLLPGLHALASRALGTEKICASIPHRSAMILFPEGDGGSRTAMKALIAEKESNKERPLTLELFRLMADGVSEFRD